MMFGSLALSPIIIIMTGLSVILIFKCVSHDSSQGLRRADWTWCQVEYYNEQKINNSSRSINRGIFVFAPNPIAAFLLSVRLVWSGQWSPESSVSPPDEQISLTTRSSPAILVMLLLCTISPRGLLVLLCQGTRKLLKRIHNYQRQPGPSVARPRCGKGHFHMRR